MSGHTRRIGLLDLPSFALESRHPHPNRAVTLQGLAAAGSRRPPVSDLVFGCTHLRPGRQIWISRDGRSLLGVAALRRRGDRTAWEIDHLIVPSRDHDLLLDLLDRVVATAGADGAHRLFLRLAEDSPVLAPAQRHGFTVVCHETLWQAERTPTPQSSPPARRRARGDDIALFRLQCDMVNTDVRWLTALAPSEWRAGLEPLGSSGEEWILPSVDGRADAFLRLARGSRGSVGAALSATPAAAAAMLDLLARRAPPRHVRLLLPDYALHDARAAEERGLTPTRDYLLLVRSIAQRAHRLRVSEHAVESNARTVIQ